MFIQECTIEVNVKPGDRKSVTLLPLHLTINQSQVMVLFTITNHDLLKNSGEGILMTITLKRKIMSEMMTTYFPSLLLMMITYATTFFKSFFFEAALSVNLTTMLVMTTIFISKMEGLPPTSATKMIDYWLILCQLVPFAQVVLLTMKENLREEEQEENLTLEKDEMQRPTVKKDEMKAKTISQRKLSKAGYLTMLTAIGKVFVKFLISNDLSFQRRK